MNEWDAHHGALDAPIRYGAPATYALAADWMMPCETVEDWGCGAGGLRGYMQLICPDAAYTGVDGSASPFADVHADLADYTSEAQGIVLRHVLEHSYEWEAIIANAIASFTRRLCIVLFTPLVSSSHVLHTEPDYGAVPVISFAIDDIIGPIRESGAHVSHHEYFLDGAHFGTETMIYARRAP